MADSQSLIPLELPSVGVGLVSLFKEFFLIRNNLINQRLVRTTELTCNAEPLSTCVGVANSYSIFRPSFVTTFPSENHVQDCNQLDLDSLTSSRTRNSVASLLGLTFHQLDGNFLDAVIS